MELDTRASVSLMSATMLRLKPSRLRLRTYSGELLISLSYGDQQKTVPLVIVEGDGASLFGWNIFD